MRKCFLLLSSFLLWLPLQSQAQAQFPPRSPDIAYIENGHERQVLDVYLPEDRKQPHPTLFMIHGGGYIFGDKAIERPVAEHFQEQGFAVVVPNYRLAPQHVYPAPLNDIFCALAWTVNNAGRFQFDLSQLVIIGESAGGNAASLIGTVDDLTLFLDDCPHTLPRTIAMEAVIAYFMPVELATCECRAAKEIAALFFGVSPDLWQQPDAVRELWQDASPLTWLDGREPSFLLIHGSDDSLIPLTESLQFAKLFRASGGDVQLHIVEGADHGFFQEIDTAAGREALHQVDAFLAGILNRP